MYFYNMLKKLIRDFFGFLKELLFLIALAIIGDLITVGIFYLLS